MKTLKKGSFTLYPSQILQVKYTQLGRYPYILYEDYLACDFFTVVNVNGQRGVFLS
jgi:hypothetical protein